MQWVGFTLILIGLLMSLIGAIRFYAVAFRDSFLWFLGCLFVPFCALIYLVKNWEETKSPFFTNLLGTFMAAGGLLLVVYHGHVPGKAAVTAKGTNTVAVTAQSATSAVVTAPDTVQTAANVPEPALRLQAIVYSASRSSAIINGKTVFVGDQVAGWEVKVIGPESVTLSNAGGETNTLLLK